MFVTIFNQSISEHSWWSHWMLFFLVYTVVLTLFQARKLVKITIYKETERKFRAKLILKNSESNKSNSFSWPKFLQCFQFDLVCDRAFLGWLANAILYFGWAVGSLVLGTVADKCGRKNVLFPSLTVMLVATFAMAFAKAVWVVLAFRFIIGVCQSGAFQSIFVLSTELVGPEKRALATAALWFYYTGALMVLGLKAYFVRDWRMLMILSSAPWIFILIFWK